MGERALTRPCLLISARFDAAAGVKTKRPTGTPTCKAKQTLCARKSEYLLKVLSRASDGKARSRSGLLNGGQYISRRGVVKRQHFGQVRSVAVWFGLLVWFVSLNLAALVFSRLSVRILQRHAYADDRANFDRFAGAGSLKEDNSGRPRLIRARHHYLHV
jgi:hypothetical protein